MLSVAKMGLWQWDLLKGEIKCSPHQEQLFGLAPGSFDGQYETFEACLHPEDRSLVNQALQTRSDFHREFRVIWPDGSTHWLEGKGQAVYNKAGQPVQIMGTFMDIDERKQVEADLRSSLAEIEAIYQSAPIGLNVLDTDLRFIRINKRLSEMNGLPMEAHIGHTVGELLPDIADTTEQLLRPILVTGNPLLNVEITGETPAQPGVRRTWLESFLPLKNGDQIIGISTVCEEITERKQAEADLKQAKEELESRVMEHTAQLLELNEQLLQIVVQQKQTQVALSQSEERLRLALDFTQIGFWDWHFPSGKIVWNDNHFTLIGLVPHTIQPSYEVWRHQVHPEDIGWVEQRFFESIETRTIFIVEYRVMHPDGSVHWLMARAKAIYDQSGQPMRSLGVLLDVTERKLTETTLYQYQRIVSTIKDGIALLDRNYIYQMVNQAYLDWRNKSNTEVMGQSKRVVFGDNLFDHFIQTQLDKCLAGETVQHERWLYYPHSVPQFLSVTYTPYREPDGSISGVIISLRNLTQLKQAEQMLDLQAVITRNMAEGVCLIRTDQGIIVYANPKFEQMFGYDSGELNGQHVSIVNYGTATVTAQEVYEAIRSSVLENGEATYEVLNVKKNGTPFWCSATTSEFKYSEYGTLLVAVQQDITDRKRTEDALRESEEKFRQLAENIQAVFWMTDIHSQQVLYVSPAYETIWHRSCQSLYQNSGDWLDAIHPEDHDAYREHIRTGQSDIKYRLIHPDGSIRWIRDRAFPIKNPDGEVVRIAGIAEDITELQMVEQMKNEFIGIVSHELRTPLTSIRAALGLLHAGTYDNRPDKFKRMIEIAAIESDRLVRLVNDILTLERLEAGQVILEKTTWEAVDLVHRAVAGVSAIAELQQITFTIHPTSAKVWANADAIMQTLTNLLSNALKFSPRGSTITINIQQQPTCVLFQVSDQGQGIPTDKLEAIFGKFQQVDSSDSRDKGGTGLGLAICRSIIEQHGGKIWAQNNLGVGSTFFFTLPFPPQD